LSHYISDRVIPDINVRLKEKPRTIEFYVGTFKQICLDPIGSLALNKIKMKELADFTRRCDKSELQVATINRRLACIRKALRLALEEDVLYKLPKFKMLEGENRRERILVGEERAEFLAGMSDSLRPATEFAFETGLRITELCTLTKDRVELNAPVPYIKIPRAISKSKEDRFVPLTPRAQEIVLSQMMLSRSSHVFTRYGPRVKGNREAVRKPFTKLERAYVDPISRHTLSHAFSVRAKEMGIVGLVFHSTRHSAATEVGAAGANLFTLMTAFGWKSPEVAKRYVHPMQDDVAKAFLNSATLREQKMLVEAGEKKG
jgi:integrase